MLFFYCNFALVQQSLFLTCETRSEGTPVPSFEQPTHQTLRIRNHKCYDFMAARISLFVREFMRQDVIRSAILVSLSLLLTVSLQCSAQNQRSRDEQSAPVVFNNDTIQIISDVPITKSQAQRISAIFDESYAFALHESPLPDRVQHDRLITVHILPPGQLGSSYAACQGLNEIRLNPDALHPDLDRLGLGLAHECTHLIHHRAGASLPRFLEEGVAKTIGYRYLLKCRTITKGGEEYWEGANRSVSKISANFAEHVLEDDIAKSRNQHFTGKDEYTGELYFEFLRSRLNGSGVNNALVRMNKLIEYMPPGLQPNTADWWDAYHDAFARFYDTSVEDANKQFLAYMIRTEGNPKMRLNHTIFTESRR